MSDPVTCVGCGFTAKNELVAYSDGLGCGFRQCCAEKISLCQECIRKIGHIAIDL